MGDYSHLFVLVTMQNVFYIRRAGTSALAFSHPMTCLMAFFWFNNECECASMHVFWYILWILSVWMSTKALPCTSFSLYKSAVFLQKSFASSFHLIDLNASYYRGEYSTLLLCRALFTVCTVFRLNGPEYIILLHCYTEGSLCFYLMAFVKEKKITSDMDDR